MKVLVTGGLGYLGAHICRHLLQEGHEVTATYRQGREQLPAELSKLKLLQLDLSKGLDALAAQVDTTEAVIHTVSFDHHQTAKLPAAAVTATNILPAWDLLEYFSAKGLQKFIYLSTMHVMGRLEGTQLDEAQLPQPLNAYGLTHLMTEQVVSFFNRQPGLNGVSLRLSNGYGSPVFEDNNCWWLVINDLCRMAVREKKIALSGDGTALRDFVHVSDIAAAVHTVLKAPEAADIINVSSGNAYSMLQLACKVRQVYSELYQSDLPVYIHGDSLAAQPATGQSGALHIPSERLRALGFQPMVSLELGIAELLTHITQHA